MNTESILKKFYQDVAKWLETGETTVFYSRVGLCGNFQRWWPQDDLWSDDYYKVKTAMKEQFKNAGLHIGFPFSKEEVYYIEQEENSLYLNPERLAWIKKHSETE